MPSPKIEEVIAEVEQGVKIASYFATGFTNRLRAAGIPISLLQTINFTKSLGVLPKTEPLKDEIYLAVYLAGRVCLLSSPQHIHIYDKIYKKYLKVNPLSFIDGESSIENNDENNVGDEMAEEALENGTENDTEDGTENDIENPDSTDFEELDDLDEEIINIRYSPTETLYQKDFSKLTSKELLEAKQIISQMKMTAPPKTSRRFKSGKFKSPNLDIKEIARLSTQTDGEPIRQAFLKPRQTNRKIVLLLDISGSMEDYARVMLRFTHTLTTHRNVEAFTLSTRLTRITKELFSKNPDLALSQVTESVKDWSGGTRLGESLETFNNQWGIKGMARGAVVVILSDGWDKGDTQKLSEQMARLSRVVKKIIWVNPLKASEGYEPLAQGMAAALPWIDNFVEGHSLFSLQKLAELVIDT